MISKDQPNQPNLGILQSLIFLALFTLAIWISKFYWKRRHFFRKAAAIPGPKGLPFFWLTIELALCHPDSILAKIYKYMEGEGITKCWLANKLLISLREPEHIATVLCNKNCLEKDNIYDSMKVYVGDGLFSAPVTKWKKNRKILRPSFHSNILNGFLPIICEKSEILMDVLEKSVKNSEDLNILEKFCGCTTDIICETAMGINVHAQTSPKGYGTLLDKLMEILTIRITNIIYYPDIFFNMVYGKEYREVLTQLHDFSEKMLEEKKEIFNQKMQAIEKGTYLEDEESGPNTFLKQILELSYKGERMSDQQIKDEINTIIVAGADTSATAMSFCCIMLGMFPEYQKKVYDEAIEILGEDRDVTLEDLPRFQFLEMCLKETLRLFPSAPVVIRVATADIEIDNLTIPEGSSLFLSILNLHRNPRYWKDPLKFDPYRFLPEEAAKRHPFSYLPFMGGPRNCIGRTYSFMSMKAIMTKLIRRFEVKTEYKSVEDIELKLNIMLRPIQGCKVTFQHRK